MYGYAIWLAVAALGVEVGWQRLPEGGVQYLIQIPPESLDALKAGEAIESDIPPTVKDIRGYRITVGNKQLPRDVVTNESRPATGSSQFSFSRPAGSPSIAGGPPSTTAWPTNPSPTGFTPMPHTLPPEPTSKPLAERPASFLEPATPAAPKPETQPAPAATTQTPTPSSYLGTYLTASLVALSGSLAWNGYLLWMLREARRRYRLLLERTGATEADLEDEEEEEEEEEE